MSDQGRTYAQSALLEKKEEYLDVKELPCIIHESAAPPPGAVTMELISPDWLGNRAVVLHDVLTTAECARVVDFFESHHVTEKCMARTDYRNNYRVVAVGKDTADAIYARIAPFLPPTETIDESNKEWYVNSAIGMHGTWKIDSLNPCFRICKYDPDGHFSPHCDGDYVRDADYRSLKTFMIYINDDYQGGATNFLESHALFFDESTQRFKAPAEAIRASLKASRGDALIFDHNILHEGATVASGVKYIMRCEVMYARSAPDLNAMTPAQRTKYEIEARAFGFLRQAQALEADRRELEAVEFYRKAFKLCPELERV